MYVYLLLTSRCFPHSPGGPGLTGTATVTVLVKDVNDHSPVFESHGPYVAHVAENRVAGAEVVRVSAADGDEGLNAQIL